MSKKKINNKRKSKISWPTDANQHCKESAAERERKAAALQKKRQELIEEYKRNAGLLPKDNETYGTV